MKALSLKQPFAELVVLGRKTIELRKWNTKFRGRFLIHASLTPDSKSMKSFGFGDLPKGCIVGEAELVDVKIYGSPEDCDKDKKKHLADNGWGKYGFVLENIKRVPEVKAKGMLGFWEFKPNPK